MIYNIVRYAIKKVLKKSTVKYWTVTYLVFYLKTRLDKSNGKSPLDLFIRLVMSIG